MAEAAVEAAIPTERDHSQGQRAPYPSSHNSTWPEPTTCSAGPPNAPVHQAKPHSQQEPTEQRRTHPPPRNSYHGTADADALPSHQRDHVHHQQHDDRYAQTPVFGRGNRSIEYMTHYPRPPFLDIRVYATPYGYTANNEPLFIQYGTPSAEIAAQAVLPIGSRYTYSTHYDYEGHDPHGHYLSNRSHVHGGYSSADAYRYGYRSSSEHYQRHGGEEEMEYQMRTPRSVSERRYANLSNRDIRNYGTNRLVEEGHDCDERVGNEDGTTADLPIVGPTGETVEGGSIGEGAKQKEKDMEKRYGRGEEEGRKNRGEMIKSFPFRITQKGSTGRITWTEELHQEFLKAVDEIGLENAVPMSILNKMEVEGLTREQVASHLQKHRTTLKKEREVKERELLLNVAAKSVIEREGGLGKRNLTAEEVLSAVEEEAKANGEGVSPLDRKRRSVKDSFRRVGKRVLSPGKEEDGDWKGKRVRRYLPRSQN